MNIEIQTETATSETQDIPIKFTRRAKRLAGAAGIGLVLAAGAGMVEVNTTHFDGEKQVEITDNTVTDIALNNVDGASDHIKATVHEIVKMNPQVFQDGKAFVDSEDTGKTIVTPESAD